MARERALRLMIVSGTANEAETLANTCRNAGLATRYRHLPNPAEVNSVLQEEGREWDIIVMFLHEDLTRTIGTAHQTGPDIPVIVVSDAMDESLAIGALARGARDVVAPEPTERLLHVLFRELDDVEHRRDARRWERELHECEQRAQTLLDSSRDAIAYLHEGMHIYANAVYLELFGFDTLEDIQGMPFLDLVAPKDHARFKEFLRHLRSESAPQPIELHAVRTDDSEFETILEPLPASMGGESGTQITLRRPAQENQQLQEEVVRLSQQDPLTGLYNRQHFLQAVQDAVESATDGRGDSTLLYIELDNFRAVRDKLGIAGADRVVAQIAALLARHADATDVLARLGDEVFTLLIGEGDLEQGKSRAETVRRALEEHVSEVDGQTAIATCSIGICLVSARFHSVQEAMQCAESACSGASKAGGNQVGVYQASQQEYQDEKQWPKRIRQALISNGLGLFYQPIVSLHGEPAQLYQVLVRMIDGQGNIILPRQFLSAAVKADLMTAIDHWIIDRAMTTLSAQHTQNQATVFFVKLSDQALKDDGLTAWIKSRLGDLHLAGASLIFQLDEASALLYLNAARAFADKIHALGCRFALGHFGTGTNPLAILKHLPVDFLFIDGSLIKNLAQDARRQAALTALIDAAKEAGKLTVSENVEDANTLALLWQCGTHYAMGYYIQEPGPMLDFDFGEGS